MARRRMFSLDVVDTDIFQDMPLSSQCLYFHFGMKADDAGFINNAKTIIKLIGCTEEDLNTLIEKGFIIQFDNGLIVIKHWKINNVIRADRYKETMYLPEKKKLEIDEYGIYKLKMTTNLQPNDNQMTSELQPNSNQFATNLQPSGNQTTSNLQPNCDQMTTNIQKKTEKSDGINKLDNPQKPCTSSDLENDNQVATNLQPICDQFATQYSIDKISIDKISIDKDSICSSKQEQEEVKKNWKNDYKVVSEYYESNITMITDESRKVINNFLAIYDKAVLMYAIDITVASCVRKCIYFKAILNNWKRHRIKTLEEAKEYSLAHYNEAKTLSAEDRVKKLIREGKINEQ